jgi:HK97 family phage portal protein
MDPSVISQLPITESTPPVTVNVWSGALSDPAAAVVNEYSVLSIPAFWSGVRFISETLAGLPKGIFQQQGQSRQPVAHALNSILSRQVNPCQIPFTLFETWHSHALLHGNGYLFITRSQKTAAPTGLILLNPNAVTPFRFQGAQWFLVRGGTSETAKPTNMIIPGADVLHLAGLGFDGMTGYPVVWLMYEALELARNYQRFASKYLKRGTQIQGSVEIPGSATRDQIDAIMDRMRRSHNGIDSDSYTFTVLTQGAKLNNATIPPEQSQLLQSRQFAVIDMCRILRVPPHIVYDLTRATWANIETMSIEVVKYSLMPWIQKAEQEFSAKLLTTAEQNAGLYVRFSVDSLMRGDTKTQASNVLALVNGGIITANEGRAALEMAPLDDPAASKLRIPVNNPLATMVDTPASSDPQAPSGDDFAMFRPLLDDVVNRVETKTARAFASNSSKAKPEFTIWANVFAEEQSRYVADALQPVCQVIQTATGQTFDSSRIAEQYAFTIRARAAGQPFKPLADIIHENPQKESTNDPTTTAA